MNKVRANPTLAGIIVLSLGLNFYGLNWGLPYPPPPSWLENRFSNDVVETSSGDPELETVSNKTFEEEDEEQLGGWKPYQSTGTISPIGPLAAAKDKFSWGRWSKRNYTYPLAHYILLAGFYAPYVAYLYFFGGFEGKPTPGYPYGLSDPLTSLTIFEIIARSVAAVMGTGIVLSSYLVAREVFGKRAGIFSAFMVAICYPLIFHAHVPTIDLPYIFWFMWAFYAFILLVKTGRTQYYVLLGVLTALAFATKDQVYALLPFIPLMVLWFHYRHHYPDGNFKIGKFIGGIFERQILYGSLGFLATFALANNLIFNFPRAMLHYGQIAAIKSQDRYLDPSVLFDHFLLLRQTLYFLGHSLGLPLLVICIAGLFYSLYVSPGKSVILMLPLVSYYVLFIVISAFYVHTRHVLPIAIFLSFFGGKLLADLTEFPKIPRVAVYMGLAPVLIYSLLLGLTASLSFTNDTRRMAEQWLNEHVQGGATVEVYSKYTALPYTFADDLQVSPAVFGGSGYSTGLNRRQPDYIILTEREYRTNADRPETVWLAEALNTDTNLQQLMAGELGYHLKADFKFKVNWLPWLSPPDIVFGHNPRIFVFARQP